MLTESTGTLESSKTCTKVAVEGVNVAELPDIQFNGRIKSSPKFATS